MGERMAAIGLRAIDVQLELIEGASLSPSGERVVVSAAASDGRRHLFVVGADGAASQITSGSCDDWSPRFSADGTKVAFVSDRSGNRDVWVVPAAGGEPRRVTTDPADDVDPEWSPDGARIVFASSRGGPRLLHQVMLADLSVFSLTAGAGSDRRPAWSPDGKWIAFESTRDGVPHVWLIPPEGGEARRLSASDHREERWPAWLSDGRGLLAIAGPAGSPGGLWHFQIETGGAGLEPSRIPIPAFEGYEPGPGAPVPALSRDGRLMAFATGGDSSVQVIPFQGGSAAAVAAAGSRLRHPTWSRDGRRLVVVGDARGSWDLWIAGVSSGRLVQLTDDEEREEDPSWSTVTGDILFGRRGPEGRSVHILEPETKRVIRLSQPGPARDSEAAWSPDGRWVAYASEGPTGKDIHVVAVGGTERRRLTSLAGTEAHPTWSPDGKWIAFASDQGSGSTIWKVPAEGGAPMPVTTLPAGAEADIEPAWSPDGTWIAFARLAGNASGGSDIFIVPATEGRPFPLRRGGGARLREPAWSPDSKHLAFSQTRADRLYLLEISAAAPSEPQPQPAPPAQKPKAQAPPR